MNSDSKILYKGIGSYFNFGDLLIVLEKEINLLYFQIHTMDSQVSIPSILETGVELIVFLIRR